MTAIAIQYRDQIIAQVAQGQRLIDIAQSLGYKDHSAIVHRLKDDPAYMIARETGAEARLEARERELEVAPNSVTVARARELLSHARWRAEREFPHRWGQTNKVQVEHIGDRADELRSAKARVIEGEVIPSHIEDKTPDSA